MLKITRKSNPTIEIPYGRLNKEVRSTAEKIEVVSGKIHTFDFYGLIHLTSFEAPKAGLEYLENVSSHMLPELEVFLAPNNELRYVNHLLNLPQIEVIDLSYNMIEQLYCDDDVSYRHLKLDHNPFRYQCRLPKPRHTEREDMLWVETIFKFIRNYPDAVQPGESDAEAHDRERLTDEVFGL